MLIMKEIVLVRTISGREYFKIFRRLEQYVIREA
jgi:hypothetical protein